MDKLSITERSRNMSAIHNKNTKPELYIRKLLFSNGYRYRLNVNYVPGHPDVFLRKYNTAIFVHGCFWHRHVGCKFAYTPKTRADFWNIKFENNLKRDRQVTEELRTSGFKQLIIWECTIRKMAKDSTFHDQVFREMVAFLNSNHNYSEF